MATKTNELDTELSAVNSILGAIGQSPITQLKDTTTGSLISTNPEISFIYNILTECNLDIQSEGWHFNSEEHVAFTPDPTTKHITVANNVLRLDVTNGWQNRTIDTIRKDGKLWDKVNHTFEFTGDLSCDVVYLYEFENIPPVFRRYVIYKASARAATQLIANPDLVKLLTQQEAYARAACIEYETQQGNHSMLGFTDNQVYQTYQPWRALAR
jgi:hypothetical protein